MYDPRKTATSRRAAPAAGCCAAVLCAHILPRLQSRSWRRVLFIATGALMSQTTVLQRETIPAVAHLVFLEAPGADD
jgi:stage V sporulation protein AD